MQKACLMVALLVFVGLPALAFAQNGEYDAYVSTESGTYRGVVEVEDGEVVYVRRKDGDQMTLEGAKIVGGQADGTDSNGKSVHIEIDNYNAYTGEVGRTGVIPGTIVDEGTGAYDRGTGSDVP